MFAEISLDDFE